MATVMLRHLKACVGLLDFGRKPRSASYEVAVEATASGVAAAKVCEPATSLLCSADKHADATIALDRQEIDVLLAIIRNPELQESVRLLAVRELQVKRSQCPNNY